MEWTYKGTRYKSIVFNWFIFNETDVSSIEEWILQNEDYLGLAISELRSKRTDKLISRDLVVYLPQNDKCYSLASIRFNHSGSRCTLCLDDIYNHMKSIYVPSDEAELVVKA